MKFLFFNYFFIFQILSAQWIQPPDRSPKGYLVPSPDYTPNFPRDHGSHPKYGIEWWYWVGHLKSVDEKIILDFNPQSFRLGSPGKFTIQSFLWESNLFLVHSA